MKRLAMALGIMAAAALPVFAQTPEVPSLINYQATLTDANGDFLEDGASYEIEFRIWSAATGGTLVWSRAYTVTILNGRLNVILGATGGTVVGTPSVNDIGFAFTEKDRFLGMTVTKDKDGAAVAGASEIVPRQQIISAPYALAAKNGVPRGTIVAFGGSSTPEGWLLCDGSEQNTSTYPDLSALLGTTWGSAASGKFKLPDLRGRTLIGSGQGSGLTNRSLGQFLGEESHTLTVSELPPHTHSYVDRYHDDGDYDVIEDGGGGTNLAPPDVDVHNNTTGSTGDGTAHNVMQPSAVVRYIIKY